MRLVIPPSPVQVVSNEVAVTVLLENRGKVFLDGGGEERYSGSC